MIPFSWSNPYAWPRKPLLSQNVVATSQPFAAGGNAVDAILATAITVSLVEPVPNGIGSDAHIASGYAPNHLSSSNPRPSSRPGFRCL
jgi:gamma-glutamyltranspeptidase